MPKVPTLTLSQKLAQQKAKSGGRPFIPVVKETTDRAKQVMLIWASVKKPSRKFETEEEQEAYKLGVADERECQREYDDKLRTAGLR